MAAAALARRGDAAALAAVRDMLRDDDPQVFRTAAWVPGFVGGPDDIEPLRGRLSRAPDESARAFVEHALATLGDPIGLDAVARNLDSADPWRDGAVDNRGIAIFFLSDDVGKTWRESRDWLAFPGVCSSGLQEPGVIERQDGPLLAWCRTEAGWQYETESRDGGETWSVPRRSPFRSPCAPLSIKRMPSTGHLVAVWNDHSSITVHRETDWGSKSWGRKPLTLAVSPDDGRSWQTVGDVETDPDHRPRVAEISRPRRRRSGRRASTNRRTAASSAPSR